MSMRQAQGQVLNAFRHQRKDHSQDVAAPLLGTACSTPFGIRGRITRPEPLVGYRQSCVLNAFRHQRKDHLRLVEQCHTSIPVLNAFRHQRKDHKRFVLLDPKSEQCSTPFGIRGRITGLPRQGARHHGVCSTPFGIRGRITRRPVDEGIESIGAQRLSASEEGSLKWWLTANCG